MRYIVLTGALKNVGDYLIAERAKALISYYKPNAEIVDISRYESLDDRLELINSANAVILAGGPGYRPNMYPSIFKLTKNLDHIQVPIICMGMGWRGFPGDDENVYNYKYDSLSQKFLERSSQDYYLGCRDYLTERTLKNNGFKNTLMTGCVAWYDMNYITKDYVLHNKVENIVFSNPAETKNTLQAIEVIKLIKEKYPNAKLYCAFHRGIEADNHTNKKEAEASKLLKRNAEILGYEILDLSHNLDSMKIYDEADLHIGYRVHAHIYCISHYRKSILIEEDGRGRGVNEAFGLYGVKARESVIYIPTLYRKLLKNKFTKKVFNFTLGRTINNGNVIKNLSYYIDELENNDYRNIEAAFVNLKNTFPNMERFIKQLP